MFIAYSTNDMSIAHSTNDIIVHGFVDSSGSFKKYQFAKNKTKTEKNSRLPHPRCR